MIINKLWPNRSYIRKKEKCVFTLILACVYQDRNSLLGLFFFTAHKIHHNRDKRGCLAVLGRDVVLRRAFGFWVCPPCMREEQVWRQYSHKNDVNAFSDIAAVSACAISAKCGSFSLLFCLEGVLAVWGCSLPLSLSRPCMV